MPKIIVSCQHGKCFDGSMILLNVAAASEKKSSRGNNQNPHHPNIRHMPATPTNPAECQSDKHKEGDKKQKSDFLPHKALCVWHNESCPRIRYDASHTSRLVPVEFLQRSDDSMRAFVPWCHSEARRTPRLLLIVALVTPCINETKLTRQNSIRSNQGLCNRNASCV